MSFMPLDLLRSLGGVVAGGGVRGAAANLPRANGSSLDFNALLAKAQSGEVRSGLEVRVGTGVDVKLTDDQLARLSEAADRAEAQGASRALVFIDGMALKLDVGGRTITGTVDLSLAGATAEVDAVVVASADKSKSAVVKPPAASTIGNASLAKALDRDDAMTL